MLRVEDHSPPQAISDLASTSSCGLLSHRLAQGLSLHSTPPRPSRRCESPTQLPFSLSPPCLSAARLGRAREWACRIHRPRFPGAKSSPDPKMRIHKFQSLCGLESNVLKGETGQMVGDKWPSGGGQDGEGVTVRGGGVVGTGASSLEGE